MNFFLIGILMGTFPTLQSPVIPLNKKMVPAFFSFLVMALLDWSDGSIILFLGMAVMTNWVYQRDILNMVVDKMMQMMIEQYYRYYPRLGTSATSHCSEHWLKLLLRLRPNVVS